ncbi:type I secretion system permease/ATPase [Mesorhizobium loti]|nr:type I secretion system permease/ATPase [Mesorhizobium loti]
MPNKHATGSQLREAIAACRWALAGTAAMSGVISLLHLTGAFFMLEVYDRVLPSRSVPTLVGLVILAGGLFLFQGWLDVVRARLFTRVGRLLDERLSGRVHETLIGLPLVNGETGDGLQPLRDLDQIRGFLSGGGPGALFDLPWLPLYVGICFMFHAWIGSAVLVGALLLVFVTLMTERLTREPSRKTAEFGTIRNSIAGANRRNAEVVRAMGMAKRVGSRWSAANESYMDFQQRASDVATGLGGLSKSLRMMLQSGVLALGAYLVVNSQASVGIITAASILSARALAPVERAIANWKGFVGARQGWQRLSHLLQALPLKPQPTRLPKPVTALSVQKISVAPPGASRLAVQEASFELRAGQGLGIIGPSASGKSSLARAIVGVWRPMRGDIRLDGAALDQWSPEALGQHIGYLPQEVELFAGTIAENISRFAESSDDEAIISAARAAGVHNLILRLGDGYQTIIGVAGIGLSAGQRQRIGLARALYGDPFLVVLDEPNSNLDAEGDEALTKAILKIKERGGIAIVVAHRPSALAGVDHVLIMMEGRQHAFGLKSDVLSAPAGDAAAVPTRGRH